MKRSEWKKFRDETIAEIVKLNDAKGNDYAGDDDVFLNFHRRAKEAGVTPLKVWSIYCGKHWDALQTYIRNGQVESEPVESRIDDLLVYLLLAKGMIYGKKNKKITD